MTKRFTQTSGCKWHPNTEARVYLKDKIDAFPWTSDLEILTTCQNWKIKRTIKIVTETMQHVSGFSPVPLIFNPPQVGPIGTYEMLDYPFDDPHLRRFTAWRLSNLLNLCKVCEVSAGMMLMVYAHQYFFECFFHKKFSTKKMRPFFGRIFCVD